jgi:proteasome lid subunit RPN8/RPN11
MIRIDPQAWRVMVQHARMTYPKECCGILRGAEGEVREIVEAIPCENVYTGDQKDRFLVDPKQLLAAEKKEFADGLSVLGFYHSHPDCGAYFSDTDRTNTWSHYSNVVLSVRNGEFADAACFRVNEDRTKAIPEEMSYGEDSDSDRAAAVHGRSERR